MLHPSITKINNIGGQNVGKAISLHPAPFVIGHFQENIYGNRGIPMSYTCHQFGVTNGVKTGGFLIESIFSTSFSNGHSNSNIWCRSQENDEGV